MSPLASLRGGRAESPAGRGRILRPGGEGKASDRCTLALLAREVGIPAVMAVHGALEALPDGTRVRVNGTSGFVERL